MDSANFRFSSSKALLDPNDLQAVAVDLDGTFLRSDAVLSEFSARTLRRCLSLAVPVIFCTGRCPKAVEQFWLKIGADGPMVFYNGAAVIDCPAGKLVASRLLASDISLAALEIARALDLYFHVFLPDDRLVYERERPEAAVYAKRTGLIGEIRDLDLELREGDGHSGIFKAMLIGSDEKLKAAEAALDERFTGQLYWARSHDTFLELMALGVSKGEALLQALQARGLEPARTLAFGDAENDLPMLAVAGYAAVPANASAGLQAQADVVVPSNDDDGPAQFLNKLLDKRQN